MASLPQSELTRYSRQLRLPEIGLDGQTKLRDAKVLIIGAGGLGSPAALYLAGAGIGTLGIADMDTVEPHNLHRQILHSDATVGRTKVESAVARLRTANPFIDVVPHSEGVNAANAIALFTAYDVIIDGTDNFATRYLNNDAARLAQRPLVHGSVFKFEGQVTVFDPAQGGPCYRCLFAEPPADGAVPNCAEAGVLGALCGVIGSLQALEAIKLIVGTGAPLVGRLLTYDALAVRFTSLTLPRDPACPCCGAHPSITSIETSRYGAACGSPPLGSPAPASSSMSQSNESVPLQISVSEAHRQLSADPKNTVLIDVREPHEIAICAIDGSLHIPMRQIPENLSAIPSDKYVLVHCHHGGRSLRVTEYLRAKGLPRVSNVDGGIDGWAQEMEPAMARY